MVAPGPGTSQGTIERNRTGWPFLRDPRIDAYAGLQQRYLDPEDPAQSL